jgi:DNA (cytosine-5)-methyltransferase 1
LNDGFVDFPISPIEILYGDTLGNLNKEYKSVMKDYEKNITKIKSVRQEKYLKEIWSKYKLKIWQDYLYFNNYSEPLKDIQKWNIVEKINESHKTILTSLGYYGTSVEDLMNSGNKNSELLNEVDHVKERMKYIPPGENHEFVKNTEHHVTGLMSNIYRRIHPLTPSPTIIACGGGGTWGYHFKVDRQKLTNRERARLQTFPDDFVFEGTSGQVRTQIGNAVPPLASKMIAMELSKIFNVINH